MIQDATLYELATKRGRLEELPSGRLAVDDEPLCAGDEIRLPDETDARLAVAHDGHQWYAVSLRRPFPEYALLPGMRCERVGPHWRA